MATTSPTTAKPMSGEMAETCESDERTGLSKYGPVFEDSEEEDDEDKFNQNEGEIQSWILEEYLNKHPTKEQDNGNDEKEAETSYGDGDDKEENIPELMLRGDPDLSDDEEDDTLQTLEARAPTRLIQNPYAKA
jgi:hypothetical protein